MSSSSDRVSVRLRHSEGLKFDVEVNDRRIELNSSKTMGHAFTPIELFLMALVGCTAMDVQWIMDTQRQKVDKFDMFATDVRREEDPRYYESIEIRYNFTGSGLRKDAVERAIRLSQEKYCSVRAMLKESVSVSITYSIAAHGEPEQTYTLHPA
jgi:putative redox protein